MISNKVWELITIQMVIFIKESGKMENQMDKEIIFTKVEKLFTKVIGRMVKRKDLES
jgi:hypothetical protein